MSNEDESPAASRSPRKFLRKKSGSQHFFNKISYLKPKQTYQSDDMEVPQQQSSHQESEPVFRMQRDNRPLLEEHEIGEVPSVVPQLNLPRSPPSDVPQRRTDRDSGRESGHSGSDGNKNPQQHRPDSGYSEFDVASPIRSNGHEFEETIASRISENVSEDHVFENPTISEGDETGGARCEPTVDSIILDHEEPSTRNQSVAQHEFLQNDTASFLRHEGSIPTSNSISSEHRSEKRHASDQHGVVFLDRESVSSASTGRTLSSMASSTSKDVFVHKETPIMGRYHSTPNGTEPSVTAPSIVIASSGVSSPTIDMFEAAPSEGSSNEARHIIGATRDLPLAEAFNSNIEDTQKRPRRLIRPSEATRRPVAVQTSTVLSSTESSSVSNPRVEALRPKNKVPSQRKVLVQSPLFSTNSSVDSLLATPEANHRQYANDSKMCKKLEKQLRDTILHTDLVRFNLKKEIKKIGKSYLELEEASKKMQEERQQMEEEKERNKQELLRSLNTLKRDQDKLNRRERELNVKAEEKQSEAKQVLHKSSMSLAEMRTKLSEKDNTIKDLRSEIERLKQSNARLENINKQKEKRFNTTIKEKDATINRLNGELTAVSGPKRLQIKPRSQQVEQYEIPSTSQRPNTNQSDVSRRQVHFRDSSNSTVYLPDDSYDSSNSSSVSSNVSRRAPTKWYLKNKIDFPKKGICSTYVDQEFETFDTKQTNVFDIRHINDRMCGAKLIQYANSDCRWTYGPVEVYYYGHTRLDVNLRGIDVKITCFPDQMQITRPNNEISQFKYDSRQLVEMRRTRTNTPYSLEFTPGNDPNRKTMFMDRHGFSDRTKAEDGVVLRRGTIDDMHEHVVVDTDSVKWKSHYLHGTINEWDAYCDPRIKQVKIQVELGTGEPLSILFCPQYDWVFIRHLNVTDPRNSESCCDMGGPTRKRERNGEYVAVGELLKTT